MKTSPKLNRLENFFWIFLFVNPFLDIFNGLFLNIVKKIGVLDVETAAVSVTPSLVIRMLMLLVFVAYLYLLGDKKAVLNFIPIAVVWAIGLAMEYKILGRVRFFTDAQYIARFCYNVVLMFAYSHVMCSRGKSLEKLRFDLDRLISFTLIILSLSIIICLIFGVGYPTYADRHGYRGNRGYFYAGNDVTAVLLLLTPMSIAKFMSMKLRGTDLGTILLFVLPAPLAANTMMTIGTKTAFLAVAGTYAALLLYALVALIFKKNKTLIINYVILFGVTGIIFGLLSLFTAGGLLKGILISIGVTFIEMEVTPVVDTLTSGRMLKLQWHWDVLMNGGVLSWLFGTGRGSHMAIAEMDLCEVFFYYGIVGAAAMLWVYVKAGIDFVKALFKKFDVMGFALLIALLLCCGYLTFAGHILFSVTSGFYFSFTIIYSRVYFAKKPEDILFFKTANR